MAVRITDIANELGLSEATVSLALNGSEVVNEKTKQKVLQTAKKMGYVPNAVARRLVKKQSNLIGLIVPDIQNPYFSAIVKNIDESVRENGYRLTIALSNNDSHEEENAIDEMIQNRVDGLIIISIAVPNEDSSYLEKLKIHGVPYIFCSDKYQSSNAPIVAPDLRQGMLDLASWVLQNDYQDIIYLTSQTGVYTFELREQGFRQAVGPLEDRVKYNIIHMPYCDYENACNTVQELIAQGELSDILPSNKSKILMCSNDICALGALNTLTKNGVKVPDQVAITGFDDVIFSEIASVPLTTMSIDIKEIAKTTVESLISLIKGEDVDSMYISTTLSVRQST